MFNAPLRGVRIVEQGTFITGPCAGMMLADLGADVIKVESPEGDPYRAYQQGLYSPHFQAYNRNKRAISCDLKQPGDRELFDRLVADADVYIQNFRPGTAERLGAGVKRLRNFNPRLVYCSISVSWLAMRACRLAKRSSWNRSGFSIALARPCQNFSGDDMCSAIHLPSLHSSTYDCDTRGRLNGPITSPAEK